MINTNHTKIHIQKLENCFDPTITKPEHQNSKRRSSQDILAKENS